MLIRYKKTQETTRNIERNVKQIPKSSEIGATLSNLEQDFL